jgi:methyl-accepting chemotaxis protein
MTAVIFVVLYQMRARMLEAARQRIQLELETASQVIEQGNQEAVHVSQSMAAIQQHGLFGRRMESMTLARAVLEDNPQFIGAYYGYEPNADGGDRGWLARMDDQEGSADGSGRFLPYWFRSPTAGVGVTLEPLVDMDTSLYYQGMKDKYLGEAHGQFIITEPYLYNNQNLIIEQTSPIVIDGEFVGIAGVDRGLDFLDEFVAGLRPYETANLTLISGRGRIIATTLSARIGYDVRTLAIDELYLNPDGSFPAELYGQADGKTVLDRAKADEEHLEGLDSSVKTFAGALMDAREGMRIQNFESIGGKEVLGAAARIPTGEWTLIMSVPMDEITAPIKNTIRWIGLVSLIGVVVSVSILLVMTNRLVRRINQVASLARVVADGDLTREVMVETSDETGLLQESIRDMMSSLNGLIGKVCSSTNRLSLTATELFVGARQQEGAVNEFGSSINQITAAAREIAATSSELLETMKDINQVAGKTEGLAASGRSSLVSMASTMDGLNESTGAIGARLREIDERASDIGMAVTTISKVADRTNMLSLSASIEAEKAGEFGTGFTVVAREVRRLADQTAVATLDIAQIVQELQRAVSTGVTEMDEFTGEVERGAGEVRQVSEQLQEIAGRVQMLTTRFGAVATGMQSQSDGATQIRDALVGLSDGVQQTNQSLRDLRRTSDQLQEAVGELRTEVGRFQVDGVAEGGDVARELGDAA